MHYPRHIALIPDGNRSRAKKRGLSPIDGHRVGLNNIQKIVQYIFLNTPIEVFTIWGLSTENMKKRSNMELSHLFNIFDSLPDTLDRFCTKKKINVQCMGDKHTLPKKTRHQLVKLEKKYDYPNSKKIICLCVNYGGRDEIIRAVNKISQDKKFVNGKIEVDDLSKAMDFGEIPYPELVIRTKGSVSHRLSGFLLRWIGYAELYFAQQPFPEFTIDDLLSALSRFNEIYEYRNFGK